MKDQTETRNKILMREQQLIDLSKCFGVGLAIFFVMALINCLG